VKRRAPLAEIVAATLVALALMPVAARADAVDGGSLHLKLNGVLLKTLKREGIRLVALKPATAGKEGVSLPIASGLLDGSGGGYLFPGGGFALRTGEGTARVRKLVLNTSERALRAKVNGREMKLAELAPRQGSFDGFGVDLAIKSMKLTARAASVLNRTLGLQGIFKSGGRLGSVSAIVHFEILTIHSGEVVLTVDEAFREKLASLEAEVRASGPAQTTGTGPIAISMPLEGGQIAPDASAGVLLGQGGPFLSQHDEPFDHTIGFLYTTVDLDLHVVSGSANYQPSPQQLPFGGSIGTLPTPIAAQANPDSGEISASSVPVTLHPNFVPVLNEVLGAPKGHPGFFAVGESIGTLAFRVQTR
jgi:hypothetical protein